MLKNIYGIFWNRSLASCQACALQGADSDLHHETLRRCVAGFIPCFWRSVDDGTSWCFREDFRTGWTQYGSTTIWSTRKVRKIRPSKTMSCPRERLGTYIINVNWKNNDSEPRQESVFCFLSIPVQQNLLKGPEWAMCDHVCVCLFVWQCALSVTSLYYLNCNSA